MGRALRSVGEFVVEGFVLLDVVAAIAFDGLWANRAALLHAGAILGGWALLTAGLASLLVPEVWLISGGLFLLSLAGWGHLRVLFGVGLYTLRRRSDG